MKIKKSVLLIIALSLFSATAYCAYPSTGDATSNQQGVTASSQIKGTEAQAEISRRLRAKLMADNQLSTLAQNITIVTLPEGITLKGDVASRAEKVKIENYARSMAGDLKVFNQLNYKK